MTDNNTDSIMFMRDVPKYDVVIHIPEQKIRKESLDMEPLKRVAAEQRKIIELSKTDFLSAITLNGRIIAKASGLDNKVADMAMDAGALAAGISGSGPSTAILLEYGGAEKFLKHTGLKNVIITETRKLTK